MRRYLIPLMIVALLAGCASSASTGKPTVTTTAETTTAVKSTPTTTLPHGEALVAKISADNGGGALMVPLVDAQWDGDTLILTYQMDDAASAVAVCSLVADAPPTPLTLEQTQGHVKVVGPSGQTLAKANTGGLTGCK